MYRESADYKNDLLLKNIFVQKRAPMLRENNIKGRSTSALMYILEGEYRFISRDCDIRAAAGDTVYLPKNGYYQYEIPGETALGILVNFDLLEQGEAEQRNIFFSDSPAVINQTKGEMYKLFNDLLSVYHTDRIARASLLFQLIAICKNFFMADNTRINAKKIEPALRYMEENYTGAVCVDRLSMLCGISTPHFRRLFKEVTGTTPIKYKNRLLIKSACNLLTNDGLNVSETAYALQFENIYTFSQAFKKEMGISPKKYIDEHTKKA